MATLVEYMTARQEDGNCCEKGCSSMTRAPRGPTRNSGRPTRSLVKEALRERDQGPKRTVDYAISGMTLAMRSRNGSASARRRGATSTTRATPGRCSVASVALGPLERDHRDREASQVAAGGYRFTAEVGQRLGEVVQKDINGYPAIAVAHDAGSPWAVAPPNRIGGWGCCTGFG